ncbi:MAG: CHASE3 domain-containing protein [Candidatus Sulfotelmatobacter sp.]|jgi:signal transduction histidine kinase
MSPRKNAQVAFISAVSVLLLSAVAAYITIGRLENSHRWVVHTYQVQSVLGEIDAALSRSARARNRYIATGNESVLASFEAAIPEVQQKLSEIRKLTEDNPKQQELCSSLETLTMQRIGLFRQQISLRRTKPEDAAGQRDIASKDLALAFERASIIQEMRDEEQRLLQFRNLASNRFFSLTVAILATTFVASLFLFSIHYRLLNTELEARAQAEHVARESEKSLQHLTSRLLRMQDEERRKFSRELHDSLGQYLAGVKMNLEMYAQAQPNDALLTSAIQLLDDSIAETRTISHLLHPPLLDEVGFSSAAKWYLEGFSERSGVQVKIDLPEDLGRLPRDLELGLFRVLQESLTNIHRHSKSSRAEVTLQTLPGKVILQVKDFGNGIALERLKAFQSKGTGFGVGLSGMRERVRELRGRLDIESNSSGTLISVTLPRTAEATPAITAS